MNQPLVTIMMTAYNRPYYFKLALESALQQSYANLEILVCDNSTNESVREVIEPYLEQDARIRYHLNLTSIPVIDNFKQCLRLATGEYVSFLMDDDLYALDKIERMVGLMQKHPGASLVTSYRQGIDEEGAPIADFWATERLFKETRVMSGQEVRRMGVERLVNYIGETTTPLFRRADLGLDEFGLFCGAQYNIISDLATWFALSLKGDVIYVPEPLSYTRFHRDQHQRKSDAVLEGTIEFLRLARAAYSLGDIDQHIFVHAFRHWMEACARFIIDFVQGTPLPSLRALRQQFLQDYFEVQMDILELYTHA